MAHDTIACLLSVPTPIEFIRGNGEVAVLEQLAGTESPAVPEPYRAAMRWTANDIRADYAAVVAGWPATVELELPAGRVLFCHATPRNENEIFTAPTPEQRLVPVFGGLTVPVVVCGHTHMQFDRIVGGTRVVNAGSVGMPFGAPGADWLLLGEGDTGNPTPPHGLRSAGGRRARAGHRLSVARRLRRTSYPAATLRGGDARRLRARVTLKTATPSRTLVQPQASTAVWECARLVRALSRMRQNAAAGRRCRFRPLSFDVRTGGGRGTRRYKGKNDMSKTLGITLWVVQGLLAALFLFAGGVKLVATAEQMQGPPDLPLWFLRFIGVCEVSGALGLVLPGISGPARA